MLLLECYPDEVLARALGIDRQSIRHSHGKGKLSQSLGKLNGVVGMVDEDPGSAEPATLAKFVETQASHDLKLKIDKSRGNRLVVICPKLEDWLIKTAKNSAVRLADFGLSDRAGNLHADVNQRLPNLERLLARLLELKNPRLLLLKSMLSD